MDKKENYNELIKTINKLYKSIDTLLMEDTLIKEDPILQNLTYNVFEKLHDMLDVITLKIRNIEKDGDRVFSFKATNLSYISILNFEGDVLRAYRASPDSYIIVDQFKKVLKTITLKELHFLIFMGGEVKDSTGKIWKPSNEHPSATTNQRIYDAFVGTS